MGEKWFEFVKRIKKEGNYASLSEAMKAASKRKSEWKKDGAAPAASAASPKAKSSGKKTKKARKSRKSKKSKKSRKSRKSKKR
jgi:hypothetical protein